MTMLIIFIYFNPLPRKEGDVFADTPDNRREYISIHSLVKRETKMAEMCCFWCIISIHSLVKRETPEVKAVVSGRGISIHSLVKRETANFAKIWINRILILCTFLLEHKKF